MGYSSVSVILLCSLFGLSLLLFGFQAKEFVQHLLLTHCILLRWQHHQIIQTKASAVSVHHLSRSHPPHLLLCPSSDLLDIEGIIPSHRLSGIHPQLFPVFDPPIQDRLELRMEPGDPRQLQGTSGKQFR